jgi:amidase
MPFEDPARLDLGRLRVAFYSDNGFAPADAEVAAVVNAAARALAKDVAALEEARPACLEHAYHLEMKLLGADGGDGLREYLKGLGSTQLHPLLTGWLNKLEAYRTSVSGLAGYWAEWDAYRAEMRAFLGRYDVLLCPVYTHAALPHGASTQKENFHGFSHTMAFNVAGWPAAVVRCGTSASGLPIGVQIVAAPWREDIALAMAARLESEFGGWKAPAN